MPTFTSPDAVEFRLLGPVEVWAGSRRIDIGAPKRRAALVALLLDAGASLTMDALIDRIWDEAPPAEARSVLYAHLSRIRRILTDLSAATGYSLALERRSGGYLARVDPDLVDLHRGRRLLEQARQPDLTDAERVEPLRRALSLWRGDPLAGLPGGWIGRIRDGLRRQYLDVLLAWGRVEVRLGNHDEVIDALRPQVSEHPTVEPLPLLLMSALHAAGRSAEALDCYDDTRRRLVAELGVEPGPELRALHRSILRGEVHHTGAPGRANAVTPAQLPADPRGFVGRADELATLDKLLLSTRDSVSTGAAIGTITGMPGVGKTMLAVHWAHQVATDFPDGQLYVNLRGFDPGGATVTTSEAVRGFLDALHVPALDIPVGLDAQAGMFRSLLAERQMLILLDNARDADQVRPLLPGSSRCLVVVTSRDRLAGLMTAEGAQPVRLNPMSTVDAWELLTGRLGSRRVAAEPDAAEQIVLGCSRLPLALSVVAARAVANPGFALSALASELRQARDNLDVFAAGDTATDVRSVFSWSYQALRPETAALFRLLGLHPGPDISVASAASLAGVPPRRIVGMLAELTRAHLLTEHTPSRYTCHDLLRAYATELVTELDPAAERDVAVARLLDHYLHTACAAALVLNKQRDPITLTAAVAGVVVEPVTDHDQALAWFAEERTVLMAVIQLALDNGFNGHGWQLPWSLYTFLDYRGHWDDLVAVHTWGLLAARRLGDHRAETYVRRNLGAANARLGNHPAAYDHFQQALILDRQIGEPANHARTYLNLAWLCGLQSRYAEALDHARQAWDLYEEAGSLNGKALTANSIGWYHAQLGDHAQAIDACERSLALHREAGDRSGLAATWDSLGFAHDKLNNHIQAVTCYQNALAVLIELGDRYNQARVLVHLGDSHHATSDPNTAAIVWCDALSILDELGHPDAERVRAKLDQLDTARHESNQT